MINYILLGGIVLTILAMVQVSQGIYILTLADKKDTDSIRKVAFWNILVSSTLVAIGLIIIGITLFTKAKGTSPKKSVTFGSKTIAPVPSAFQAAPSRNPYLYHR